MNYPHRLFIAIALTFALGGSALAQSTIPRNIRNGEMGGDASERIKQAVSAELKKLAEGDVQAQQQARDVLLANINKMDAAAFRAAYAAAVASAAAPLLEHKDLRVRLNTAILVARIAEAAETGAAAMDKITMALLDEKQPDVVHLWGMRAARHVLPALAAIKQEKELLGKIVPAVKMGPAGGITAEAYEALKLPEKTVVDELLKLMELRAGLFKDGVPSDPHVDAEPFVFFANPGWASLGPQGEARLAQLICTLLVHASKQGDVAAPGTPEREQIRVLLMKIAQAVSVIGSRLQDPNIEGVGKRAVSNFQQRDAQFGLIAKGLCGALKTKFSTVQIPEGAP